MKCGRLATRSFSARRLASSRLATTYFGGKQELSARLATSRSSNRRLATLPSRTSIVWRQARIERRLATHR